MALLRNRLVLGTIAALMAAIARGQEPKPADVPSAADKERIEAALKLTTEAAGKYEFVLQGTARSKVTLIPEPVLRWSNPAVGEVHGNVFLWTAGGRPVAVGSLFKWFTPHTHMSHEFHSLARSALKAKYEGKEVWVTSAPGVRFEPLPEAPAPAASAPQRLLQMRQLAKNFSATKKERDGNQTEMRLLPQPIHRYAAPTENVLDGAMFTLVQGTDPEVFLLLEAQTDNESSGWMFAATRMNSVGFHVRYKDKDIWTAEIMPWADVSSHRSIYTTFFHKMP